MAEYQSTKGLIEGTGQLTLDLRPVRLQKLERSRQLAPNPRSLKEAYKCNSRSENLLLGNLTEELRDYMKSCEGKERRTRFRESDYLAAMSMLLANLFYAYKHRAQILVSRNTGHVADKESNPLRIGNRVIIRCCDFMAEKGLIKMVIGKGNEYQHASSWITATANLIERLEHAKVAIELCKGVVSVVLRDKKGKMKPISKNRVVQATYKRLRSSVDALNETWCSHVLTCEGAPVLPFTKRIFNESLDYGGRFYGEYSTYTSVQRAKFRIDTDPVVELDYKSIHFNMLYALEGIQFVGDAYSIPGYERSVVKAASLRLLNSENVSAFKRNVTKSGSTKVKLQFATWKDKLLRNGFRPGMELEHKKPPSIRGFIEGMPDGIKGDDLFNAISERHSLIAHHFGQEKIGLKLQYLDSQVIASAILKASRNKIPVVPIHDSLVCRERDKHEVERIMAESYKENLFGFSIRIEEK